MTIFGPYSGDPNLPYSYQVGPHWKNGIGYRMVKGESEFNHFFGGSSWTLPLCQICHEPMHQILTLDLSDNRLQEIKMYGVSELPLISCLNCSTYWEPQFFKIDEKDQSIKVLMQNDKHGWKAEERLHIPVPLPFIKQKLVELKEDDIPFDEEHEDSAFSLLGTEYLFRILGPPLLAQGPIDRECPFCKEEMSYVATITGESYKSSGKLIPNFHFTIGETYLYFFLCKRCKILKTETQGT